MYKRQPVTPNKNQFGTRIFVGYQVNQYIGVEGGYTYFSQIGYNNDVNGVETCSDPHVQVQTFDVLVKGIVPIGNLGLYAKAGPVVTYAKTSEALNPEPTGSCNDSTYETNVRPEFGAGISYDLSQNWVVDVSWSRIMTGTIVNNIDYYALGITYHFVDKYCGQFLCDD